MIWKIEYLPKARKDLQRLDQSQRIQVLNSIEKVAKNPLPQNEGGYGKPLGNHQGAKLAGYYKIKLRQAGLRVVYGLLRDKESMKIVVISLRDDEAVYKIAEKRIGE